MLVYKYPERTSWPSLLQRPVMDTAALETNVGNILADVKQNGDAAVRKYAQQFDKVELQTLEVTSAEFIHASAVLDADLKKAILQAKQNIELFHKAQQEAGKIIETMPGVQCWRKPVAIEKVGLYIPGGSAPLFSTILMLGIPAMIAGCKEIVLCTPSMHPAVLYAAEQVGIERVFKIGGVQAIAAMAYGTESVPKVHKIFGPGNQYVTCAKQLVNKSGVAIDMPAGPSEVAVLADETCIPAFVAADLLSQAEHGPDSQVLLVTTAEEIIEEVQKEVTAQLALLPRKDIAALALENSRIILVKDTEEAMELLNAYAPEHLIVACKDDIGIADAVINAGSVFLGNYSPESAGDYASGTNHTLPTNGYATAYSGVSLDSFVKKITFQRLTREGLQQIGATIEIMAAAEGLDAHKNAVTIRLKYK
ncbi:histidinol dehydrogenase [Chitinophaga sp. YR573]|uniref:histidinol dehydrogenase n=1 Tax=Chitinophaga sp. YR573 TaxID=1881040 RepID=UPI0008AD6277|nr:histidinol dehydrogenase [Chitinophaga sp. YR573]SEW22487.1 histidinol dehydrogenase [Chitinophaga sp. YR573]